MCKSKKKLWWVFSNLMLDQNTTSWSVPVGTAVFSRKCILDLKKDLKSMCNGFNTNTILTWIA